MSDENNTPAQTVVVRGKTYRSYTYRDGVEDAVTRAGWLNLNGEPAPFVLWDALNRIAALEAENKALRERLDTQREGAA